MKVAAAVPRVRVADCDCNATRIMELMDRAADRGVEAVVFPELAVTGYTCGDLFGQSALLAAAAGAVERIARHSAGMNMVTIVGTPVAVTDKLYNCAAVIYDGKVLGIVPKTYIPNYSEFYEARWFASGAAVEPGKVTFAGQAVPFGNDLIFSIGGVGCGIEICEDLWVPIPPSSHMALNGAKVIFNLSATPELTGKNAYLRRLISQQSARTLSAYVYASSGLGESSTDLVFAGNGIIAECGHIMASSERFTNDEQLIVADIDAELIGNERRRRNTFSSAFEKEEYTIIPAGTALADDDRPFDRTIDAHPFVPASDDERDEHCREIFAIQSHGLAQRLAHTGCRRAVIGISGGLDSTLALLVTVHTFDRLGLDRKGIIGVTMPGFGTTDRTHDNALTLMHELGVTVREISIAAACRQHFADIGLDASQRNVAYENSQARERTQILMDIANMEGGMVIGTGDMSEAALGWATYNGDHMSMYNVNCSVPKTLVRELVGWAADNEAGEREAAALRDIVATPVSPELLPADEKGEIAQKTEDLVGPYELHDFFLFNTIRYGFSPAKTAHLAHQAFAGTYDDETIDKWLKVFIRRFFAQQYKRSAVPDGPKVGTVALSPRGDWRMPSDAAADEWLDSLE